MEIIKRNGNVEQYDKKKIAVAIQKSFASVGTEIKVVLIDEMVDAVEQFIEAHSDMRNVESIQDQVEKTLMQNGFYDEAKSYILFRFQRTERRNAINSIVADAEDEDLKPILKKISSDYTSVEYSLLLLSDKFKSFCKDDMKQADKLSALVKAAVEMTTQEAPNWEFIAARLLSYKLNRSIAAFEESVSVHSFYDKLRYLTDERLYGEYILASYSPEEIAQAATFIKEERNDLLNYSGLDLLMKRYLIRTYNNKPIESIQEMYLGIALHLAINEKEDRMLWVQKLSLIHI